MSIHVLPIHLVNKIAAGEVIERPASVVKELVENSLDAGANRIDVAIEDGGRKLISVSDDGGGMSADDMALAFVPHATSKIASEDDLMAIHTMGFRGEALASIASISHAHIRSRQRGDQGGNEIEASGETVGSVRPCAAGEGTTITIRDLFFNTPGRRKFMRTVNTELGHVSEQIARVALPHPQVTFTLTHNGRSILKLPATASTQQRCADLFNAELAAGLIAVAARSGRVGVAGLLSLPSAARASAQWQYFFLNGRYIRDRLLSHALREGFRGVMDPNRFPMAFVFLTIDPSEVDVNVHPTKIEVRFRDSQAVHSELLAALRETLNRSNLAPTASFTKHASADLGGQTVASQAFATDLGGKNVSPQDAAAALADKPAADTQRQASLRQAMADFFKSAPPPQPRLSFPEGMQRKCEVRSAECEATIINPWSGGQTPDNSPALPPGFPVPDSAVAVPVVPSAAVVVPAAIQIHNSYIVASCPDGLLIIDQHALHERLIYNDLKRRLGEGPLAAQRMLIPQTVSMTASAVAELLNHGELLARLGIDVVAFGPASVAVQSFPSLLAQRGMEIEPFLRELVDKLTEDADTDAERLLEDLLQMLACKAAVKAGDPLGSEEIQSLLARSTDAEKSSSCPHGRPTTLKMTLKDLEKQFKRI